MSYAFGDVILVPFPFADKTTTKVVNADHPFFIGSNWLDAHFEISVDRKASL